MNPSEKRQLTAIRNRLNIALSSFDKNTSNPNGTFEINFMNAIFLEIEAIEKLASIPRENIEGT